MKSTSKPFWYIINFIGWILSIGIFLPFLTALLNGYWRDSLVMILLIAAFFPFTTKIIKHNSLSLKFPLRAGLFIVSVLIGPSDISIQRTTIETHTQFALVIWLISIIYGIFLWGRMHHRFIKNND
ncbi:MAG: hypothetical protein JWM56_1052 [Candidatus Peribacteria bacterium]|nr:hypothetical protein [Candidatus Peribacteria bacterium]